MRKFLTFISENYEGNNFGFSPEEFKAQKPIDQELLHSNAQKYLTGDISHIGHDEKRAISAWGTPDGYRRANGYARGLDTSENGTNMVKHLDNALTHTIPNATWAYRGVHAPYADHLNSVKPGEVFHSNGFISTTIDPYRATHFAKGADIMAMHIPAGSKGLYVSDPKVSGWHAEREILLPRKTMLMHKGVEHIQVPEYHYSGRPTGHTKTLRLHHVQLVPDSDKSIQIDRA